MAKSGLLRFDGQRWQRDQTFDQVIFSALDFAGPNNGWAVGRSDAGSRAFMVAARYDGQSWTLFTDFNAIGFLRDVATFADGTAWAIGDSYGGGSQPSQNIYRFAGGSWNRVDLPHQVPGGLGRLQSLSMPSANEGWAGGFNGIYNNNTGRYHLWPMMLHLKDGVWREESLPITDGTYNIHQVAMNNANEGWAIFSPDLDSTKGGQLLRYADGRWQIAADPLAGSGCSVHRIGLLPASSQGWLSLTDCPDGRERRVWLDNGTFVEDSVGGPRCARCVRLA